jgi:7-cyano-7-deazaguanine synthase
MTKPDPHEAEAEAGAGGPAIVLLSGGLDSATCLALARARGFAASALTARYGQRHDAEIEAARRVAAALGVVSHLVLDLPLGAIGGSALTTDAPVPKGRSPEEMGGRIPSTYVPARNTVLLSLALAWAEVLGCTDLFVGVNAVDYSGYPDCRPEFITAFEALARVATRLGTEEGRAIRIHAPLLEMDKAAIIRTGLALGVDYGLTHSCYDPAPSGRACGACDACVLRLRGFELAGASDPIAYEGGPRAR